VIYFLFVAMHARLSSTIASPNVPVVAQRRQELLDTAAAISPLLGGRVLPYLLQPYQKDRFTAQDMELSITRCSQGPDAHAPRGDTAELVANWKGDLGGSRGNTDIVRGVHMPKADTKGTALGSPRGAPRSVTARKLVSSSKAGSRSRYPEQKRLHDPAFSAVGAALHNDVSLALSHLRGRPEQITDILSVIGEFQHKLRNIDEGNPAAQGAQTMHAIQCVAAALDRTQALPVVNLHICGESYAGKTVAMRSLIKCATGPPSMYNCSPWSDPEVERGGTAQAVTEESLEWVVSEGTVHTKLRVCFHDYCGQDMFHAYHAAHLGVPNSVYIIVVAVWDKRPGHDNPMGLDDIVHTYDTWLKRIDCGSSNIRNKHVVTVVNYATQYERAAGTPQQAVNDCLLAVQNSFGSQHPKVSFLGAPIWTDANIPGRVSLELVASLGTALGTLLPLLSSQDTPALQSVLADMRVKDKWPPVLNEHELQALLLTSVREKHSPSPVVVGDPVVAEDVVRTIAEITRRQLVQQSVIAIVNRTDSEPLCLHRPRTLAEQLVWKLFGPRRGSNGPVIAASTIEQAVCELFEKQAHSVPVTTLCGALLQYSMCIPVVQGTDGLFTHTSTAGPCQLFAFPAFAGDCRTRIGDLSSVSTANLITRRYNVANHMNTIPAGYLPSLFVEIAGLYAETSNRIELFSNAMVLEVPAGPTIAIWGDADNSGLEFQVQLNSSSQEEFQRVRKLISEPSTWRRNVALRSPSITLSL
jgi:hypothetical protein